MRDLIEEALYKAVYCVRADKVCGNFCRMGNRIFFAGKLEYELERFKNKYVIAIGKAACPMAKHMCSIMGFDDGLIATDKKCDINCKNIAVFKSSHPLSNEESVKAGEYLINLAKNSKSDDLFVFLISGGASSLIEKPKVKLDEYKNIVNYMLHNYFPIEEMNVIRKALSQIKGGKLLRCINGEVVSFVISDVMGNDLSVIGSGLTYYDKFTQKNFSEICKKLKDFDVCEFDYDSLSKDEFLLKRVTNHVIASNSVACSCLEEYFMSKGFNVLNLGLYMKGKVKWASEMLFDTIKKAVDGNFGIKHPFVLVFGGETTVEVKTEGRGGRCQHLALLIAQRLKSLYGDFAFVSFATDGKDGNSNYAGAIIDRCVLDKSTNLDINYFIKTFNSSKFFEKTGGSISSFDTMTNVADIGFFVYE